jgi:TPR repeat protein
MAARLFKRSCDLGGSAGCTNLGALYERGVTSGKATLARDDKLAQSLYEKAYAIDKNAVATAVLNQVYGRSNAMPDGVQPLLQAYRDACQAGDGRDCGFLGVIMAVAPQTRPDAAKLMQRGCELGDAWTCFEASRLHLN